MFCFDIASYHSIFIIFCIISTLFCSILYWMSALTWRIQNINLVFTKSFSTTLGECLRSYSCMNVAWSWRYIAKFIIFDSLPRNIYFQKSMGLSAIFFWKYVQTNLPHLIFSWQVCQQVKFKYTLIQILSALYDLTGSTLPILLAYVRQFYDYSFLNFLFGYSPRIFFPKQKFILNFFSLNYPRWTTQRMLDTSQRRDWFKFD